MRNQISCPARPTPPGIGSIVSTAQTRPPILTLRGDNVQAVARVNLSLLSNAAATADDQKIRHAILDLVYRGKAIDGQSYPYSPSLAGADNERALLEDAMAAVRDATAPRQWLPDDLKAVVIGAIKMITEGRLTVKDVNELVPKPGRFRRGRALTVLQARTPQAKESAEGSMLDHAAALDGGQSVNDVFND